MRIFHAWFTVTDKGRAVTAQFWVPTRDAIETLG